MYLSKHYLKDILLAKFYFLNRNCNVSPTYTGTHTGFYNYGYIRPCSRNGSYAAVIYNPQGVTFCLCSNNWDAISFDFSGCFFAKYEIDHRYFIAHIPRDKTEDWNQFVNKNKGRVKGLVFCPTDFDNSGNNIVINTQGWVDDKIRWKKEVWGLISGTNEVTSVICEEYYIYDTRNSKGNRYTLVEEEPRIDFSSIRRKRLEMNDRLIINKVSKDSKDSLIITAIK